MATAGRINGDVIGIMVNGTTIAVASTSSQNIAIASRETTSKDDLGRYNGEPTKVTESLSGDFLVAYDNNAYQTLKALARAKTKFTWRFGSVVSGDPYDTGTGFFTSLDTSAPNNDNVTGSFTIQVTGAVTTTTNP
jgi:hypothetical protein